MAAQGGARLVVDERAIAIGAGLHVTAIPAQHDGCRPPAVEDQDRLIARVVVERPERGHQRTRQQPALTRREFFPQIHDFHRGRLPDGSILQGDPVVLA